MDGIDVALIRTDGEKHIDSLGGDTLPYRPELTLLGVPLDIGRNPTILIH